MAAVNPTASVSAQKLQDAAEKYVPAVCADAAALLKEKLQGEITFDIHRDKSSVSAKMLELKGMGGFQGDFYAPFFLRGPPQGFFRKRPKRLLIELRIIFSAEVFSQFERFDHVDVHVRDPSVRPFINEVVGKLLQKYGRLIPGNAVKIV